MSALPLRSSAADAHCTHPIEAVDAPAAVVAPLTPPRDAAPAPAPFAADVARIRSGIMAAGDALRQRHPWLVRRQNLIGLSIFAFGIAGTALDAWAYASGRMPAWLCIVASAFFLSLLHEIEHDLIHWMYFRDRPWVHHLMMAGVWLLRPSTINPWTRRRMHMHHHKVSGSASDLEERAITNGERWGVKRLLMTLDSRLAVFLRAAKMRDISRQFARAEGRDTPERRRLLLAVASGYFPLGLFYYTAWHAFLLYHLADALARWSGHPFALGPAMQQAVHLLDTAAVVLLAPNALRTFCLHFVSSNMHYYGDIDSRNVVQQTQVWTSPWAAPLHLFCFNFGATHAIHHFVVRDPFYVRQWLAPGLYPLLRENGVRFNDFGTFRRANRMQRPVTA